MSYVQHTLAEFDQEMASTRKVLERIPDDKFSWKAHPKSNTLGWNASHLVEIPSWVPGIIADDSWDFNPPGGEPYRTPILNSRAEVLAAFDENVAAARQAIETIKEENLDKPWSLLDGGKVFITMPRRAVIRSFILNHLIHHRGITTVYLRLNDIPVPGMYGPSGDDS